MRAGLRKRSLATAFLNPTPPTPWFVEAVGRKVESFADHFFHHYETDLNELENYNLDTGEVQANPTTHHGTLQALKALVSAGGTISFETPGKETPKPAEPGPLRGSRGTPWPSIQGPQQAANTGLEPGHDEKGLQNQRA
jgi:hypothetical protein